MRKSIRKILTKLCISTSGFGWVGGGAADDETAVIEVVVNVGVGVDDSDMDEEVPFFTAAAGGADPKEVAAAKFDVGDSFSGFIFVWNGEIRFLHDATFAN